MSLYVLFAIRNEKTYVVHAGDPVCIWARTMAAAQDQSGWTCTVLAMRCLSLNVHIMAGTITTVVIVGMCYQLSVPKVSHCHRLHRHRYHHHHHHHHHPRLLVWSWTCQVQSVVFSLLPLMDLRDVLTFLACLWTVNLHCVCIPLSCTNIR